LWDGATGGIIANLDCGSEGHVRFTFSRDGSRLASSTEGDDKDYSLRLWNTENGKLIGVAGVVVGREMAISDDGSLIATGEFGGRGVKLWSGDALSLIDTLDTGSPIYALAFSPDLLAIGCSLHVKLYDLERRAFVASAPFISALSLSFSRDFTRLAASGYSLQLWDVPSFKASSPFSKEQYTLVTQLAFSLDCSRLASGSRDGIITLWDTRRPCQPIATQKGHSEVISALAFSPDGRRLASGSRDETVKFWDGRDGASIGALKHSFPSLVTSVAFSSSLLAAATPDTITLFNSDTDRLVHTIDRGSHSLSFSPDGSLLASAYNDYSSSRSFSDTAVFAVAERTLIATFHYDSRTTKIIFSPDGSRLAALLDYINGDFKFFDVDKKCSIQQIGYKDLNWVPNLNGTLISWKCDNGHDDCLLGRIIDRPDPYPVLWIASDVDVCEFTVGSSMFALGTRDGRVLIGQAPTSIY
jgi:WD40 repeat protein